MEYNIEDVLIDLENGEFENAYETIKKMNVDNKIKEAFKKAAEDFANCDTSGKLIWQRIEELVSLLNYKYDENKDEFGKNC